MADLDFFVLQWGLDASSHDYLLTLPPEVQAAVMETFAPKSHTQSVDALLRGFARSVHQRLAGGAGFGEEGSAALGEGRPAPWPGGAAGAETAAAEDAPTQEEVDVFVTQWGLEPTSCMALLLSQPAEVQRRVLAGFAPKSGTRNVNSLFAGFVRSMAAGQAPDAAAPRPAAQRPLPGAAPGGQDPLEAQDREIAHFATAWGLDFECVAALARQRPEVVQRMLGSFSPKEGTRNVKSLFMGFLRSVVAAPPDAAKGAPARGLKRPASWPAAAGGPRGKATAPVLAAAARAALLHPGCGARWHGGPSEEELHEFVYAWSLDDEALQKLMELGPEVQRSVLQTFKPKEGTMNVKSLFMSFLRSRAAPRLA